MFVSTHPYNHLYFSFRCCFKTIRMRSASIPKNDHAGVNCSHPNKLSYRALDIMNQNKDVSLPISWWRSFASHLPLSWPSFSFNTLSKQLLIQLVELVAFVSYIKNDRCCIIDRWWCSIVHSQELLLQMTVIITIGRLSWLMEISIRHSQHCCCWVCCRQIVNRVGDCYCSADSGPCYFPT